MNRKIGFLGCGNMAKAIIQGALDNKIICGQDIFVYDINAAAVVDFSKQNKFNISESVQKLCCECDTILMAVKPQHAQALLRDSKEALASKAIISIAAGISTDKLAAWLDHKCRVLRTMPNTPALIRQGATILCDNTTLNESEKEFAFQLFDCLGFAQWAPESLIDGVTAVSGSGPAYAFIFMEALADAGVREGLPRDLAYTLAAQTLKGSAEMMLQTQEHPAALKDRVCSPAGTTIEAVYELEKNGFRSALHSAVRACAEKSREMSKH